MSWQAYVDTELVGKGTVTKGAIVGQQGGIWAISPGYQLSQAEQNFVVNVVKDPSSAFGSGITLGGVKFITIGATPAEVIGRKGEKGVFIVPTKQAILVAEYDQPIIAGDCNVTVHKLADYLKEVGY